MLTIYTGVDTAIPGMDPFMNAALAADSWNDGRLERAEEHQYLLRLHAEVAEDYLRDLAAALADVKAGAAAPKVTFPWLKIINIRIDVQHP